MLRCALSKYEAVVTVSSNQPAYLTYTRFLPAYMAAYYMQISRSIMNPYHPVLWKSSDPILSTQLPDISVSFPNVPASELLDAMRANGARELTVKGSKVFIIPSPNPELVRAIATGGASRTTPAASNSVNIDALATLSLVRRIFANFLFTHQYPAFSDDTHLEYVEDHWMKEVGSRKRRLDRHGDAGRSSKRVHTEGLETLADDDDTMQAQEEESIPMGDKIINAIPPARILQAWGDDREIPQGHGLFVRYIEETQNNADEKAINETLTRYFLGALGESPEAVRNSYERIKRDLGVIKMTTIGKETAHLAKCIDLGLQAQARIWPVVSNEQYLGCILLGAGFQISAYGTVYVPVQPESLLQQVERAGSHRSSLSSIADIASHDAMSELHQDIRKSQSMADLRVVLKEGHLSAEERDRIVVLARGLRYKPKSLNVSTDNIVEALRLIQHPDEELPDTFPISPSALFEENRLAVVWSAFGDLAPTCNFPGGAQVNLESSKDLPKHIGFRLVPQKNAVIDMEQIMSAKRFSNCTLNRRSGAYKDRLYTGLDGSRIINALTAAVGVVIDKGKKRAGGSGNVDPGIFDEGF